MQLILKTWFGVFLTLRRCILLSMYMFSRLIDHREGWKALLLVSVTASRHRIDGRLGLLTDEGKGVKAECYGRLCEMGSLN